MQVNGCGDAVRELMTTETKKRKMCLGVLSSVILLSSLIFAGFWLALTANANKYNNLAIEYRSNSLNWYDFDCMGGSFSDTAEALKL